jgi:hypothetical protein
MLENFGLLDEVDGYSCVYGAGTALLSAEPWVLDDDPHQVYGHMGSTCELRVEWGYGQHM